MTTRAPDQLGHGDRVHDGGPDGPIRTVNAVQWDGVRWAVAFRGSMVPRYCTGRARFWTAP